MKRRSFNLKKIVSIIIVITVTVLLFFTLGCENDAGGDSFDRKYGFYIFTERIDDTYVYVSITMSDFPEVIPEITVNGQTIESAYMDEGVEWSIWINDESATSVTYSIKLDGDELTDTISPIPGHISSVTCNGIPLQDNDETNINLALSYTFEWQVITGENEFFLHVYTFEPDYKLYFDGDYEGTSYTLTPSNNIAGIDIDFSIEVAGSPDFTSGSTPNIESDTMYAYYEIDGPDYDCDIEIIP